MNRRNRRSCGTYGNRNRESLSADDSEHRFKGAEIPGNVEAWERGPYDAWVARFGPPDRAAEKIKSNPIRGLEPILPHLPKVKGSRILNVMGSNGVKAISLALLGAQVTVVDASAENARYCLEVASAAGTEVDYVVANVLEPPGRLSSSFDVVFAEMGILHYFRDLGPFFRSLESFLLAGSLLLLRDFHPVSTKLLTFRGSTAKVRKYKVTGNYFDTGLETGPAPYAKHVAAPNAMSAGATVSNDEPQVTHRYWTIGEIITAVAERQLRITKLIEEPNLSSEVYDAGIPKSFTLLATREGD